MNDAASDSGTAGGGDYASIDDLIELATIRHLEEAPGKYGKDTLSGPSGEGRVYTDPNEPWEWAAENGVAGSEESAKKADTVKINGDDTITMEYVGDPGKITWVLKGGQAWDEVYSRFEEVKPTFERTETYVPTGYTNCLEILANAKKKLKPVESLEDQAESLLEIDATNSGSGSDKEALKSIFGNTTTDWDCISKISGNLSHWDGRAAEIFKGVYIDRFPSVLTGQMLVAAVLEQALSIVRTAFTSTFHESNASLQDTYQLLEAFPDVSEGQAGATDWKQVLGYVSGASAAFAGAAALIPGPGTAISGVATIVSGGATLGAMVVESPTHKELEGKPRYIKGGTVVKIMDNFHQRLKSFLDAVQNSENELKKWLEGFNDVVSDKNTEGITVYTTWGDDVVLKQWNSFFEIKPPDLGKIDSGTSHDAISSENGLGSAPDEGASFSGELEQLLKTGYKYLPQLADNYSSLSVSNADDDIESAFTRDGGTSPVYSPWIELFQVFDSMITNSETHLGDVAKGLITAAESYASADTAAGDELRRTSDYI